LSKKPIRATTRSRRRVDAFAARRHARRGAEDDARAATTTRAALGRIAETRDRIATPPTSALDVVVAAVIDAESCRERRGFRRRARRTRARARPSRAGWSRRAVARGCLAEGVARAERPSKRGRGSLWAIDDPEALPSPSTVGLVGRSE
jgi:hypothetical protein